MERVAPPGAIVRAYPAAQYPSAWSRRLRMFFSALRSDHLILNFSLPDVLFFTVMLAVVPRRCRITTLDLFLGPLRGRRLRVMRWSLHRVDRLLVYFKNSRVFQEKLGLPASRFRYVPFKVNAIERIRQTPATDEGFIFCGGRSQRDFATFFAAVEPLGYPVKIVTSPEAEMRPHRSSLAGLRIPSNVEILTKDSDAAFFVRTMAAARLVVIPIVPDSTTQAGIAVYLQAMALGKCVVISDGLGAGDVLSGQAILVPPGDKDALRAAIQRAWEDAAVRNRYAAAGQSYALALGGEDELRRSVWNALP